MKNFYIGDKMQIQCYKHDGKVHRSWNEAVVLDVKKDYIVFGNNKTQVVEAQGTWWYTKEPAVIYFFKNRWFNIICQFKNDGIYYYCNIATPFIIEENTVKYIDYDLDLRVFPNGQYKILDRLEYKSHKKSMKYSKDLDKVINSALKDLITLYNDKAIMFNSVQNKMYRDMYFRLKDKW